MKKYLLFMVMLPMIVLGQETKTDELTLRIKSLSGYRLEFNGKYHYYYNDDDNKVRHGALICDDQNSYSVSGASLKLNYKSSANYHKRSQESYSVPGGDIKAKYKSSANYYEDSLDGAINIDFEEYVLTQGKKANSHVVFNGHFDKGIITGKWNIQNDLSFDGKRVIVTYIANFLNGEMLSFVFSVTDKVKGVTSTECSLSVNPNKTITGSFKADASEYVFQNSIITNYFYRKTGEKSEPETKERDLIDKLISGTIDDEGLLNQGYVLRDEYMSYLKDFDRDFVNLLYDLGMSYYLDEIHYSKSFNNDLMALEKVKLGTYDEAVNIIEKDKNLNYNQTNPNSYLNYLARTLRMINEEHRLYCNDKIYLTEEVGLQVINYINEEKRLVEEKLKEQERIAEEKRKEQERIAEEKRKEQERIAEEKRKLMEKIREYNSSMKDIMVKNQNYNKTLFTTQYYQGRQITTSSLGYGKHAATYTEITKELQLDYYISAKNPESFSEKDWDGYYKLKDFFKIYERCYFGKLHDSLDETASMIKSEAKQNCKDVMQSYLSSSNYKVKRCSSYVELLQYEKYCDEEKVRQQECLKFIKARNTIESNNNAILEECKNAKRIKEAYSIYFENFDKSWTADSKVDKLQPLIDVQEQLLTGLKNPKCKEVEDKVKANKIKDIMVIIDLMKKL